MNRWFAVVLGGTLACAGLTAGASAAPFADTICPEATQYVVAVGKLTKSDPAQKVYDAAQATVDAYASCSKHMLANGFREPQHYADTRSASFSVLAARALILLNRPDDARRELKQYRPLVQQVVDWQSETETPYGEHSHAMPNDAPPDLGGRGQSGSNSKRASLYRASAIEIVAAIDDLLTQLGDPPHPQAAASAAPGH
jgi:hypothetical protein